MVGARPIVGDGLLILLDGKSHSVYWREEVSATMLMIGSMTCLIEQENDTTQLRSPSPGKPVRFLIENGDRIKAGEAYAELKVHFLRLSSLLTRVHGLTLTRFFSLL